MVTVNSIETTDFVSSDFWMASNLELLRDSMACDSLVSKVSVSFRKTRVRVLSSQSMSVVQP